MGNINKNRKGQFIMKFTPAKINMQVSENFTVDEVKQQMALQIMCVLTHRILNKDQELIDLIIKGQVESTKGKVS